MVSCQLTAQALQPFVLHWYPTSCWAAPDWILLSHFLVLDLPKIALTGDINGLLLASSWLLQIFWKRKIKRAREENKKRRRETDREGEYGSPPPTTSHRRSPLFDSLPESVPPIETALQMLLLYVDYKEGALYKRNIYFGPQHFRAVVLSERSAGLIFLLLKTLFYSLPMIFLD